MTAEAIPFPAEFAANVIDLGTQNRYFPVRKRTRIGNLIGFFLLLGIAVLVFFVGATGASDMLIGMTIGAFVFFLMGLYCGWAAYSNWSKGVGLYERGFVYRDRNGFQVWHWEDIQSIQSQVTRHYYNGIYTGTTHVYTLLNKQNQKLKLTDVLQKVEELADMIEKSIYVRLHNDAVDAYNTGSMLTFGPVNVDKAGLHIGKKDFPWNNIKQVSLGHGFLQVAPQGGGLFKSASVQASAIPNLRVLLSIVDQVVGVKTS